MDTQRGGTKRTVQLQNSRLSSTQMVAAAMAVAVAIGAAEGSSGSAFCRYSRFLTTAWLSLAALQLLVAVAFGSGGSAARVTSGEAESGHSAPLAHQFCSGLGRESLGPHGRECDPAALMGSRGEEHERWPRWEMVLPRLILSTLNDVGTDRKQAELWLTNH